MPEHSVQRPDYNSPPVVETVLGVQFPRLPGFKNAHLGAFWKVLDGRQWPAVSDAPPLPAQFEEFSTSARWGQGLHIQFTDIQPGRIQIKNSTGDRMIQVQNGRLHYNWLGGQEQIYPRYEQIREGFSVTINQFLEFVAQEQLGDVRPNQWEVTYVNEIPKGTVWNSPTDWTFFLPLGSFAVGTELLRSEAFSGSWKFVIGEQRGRLHVDWQHALRTRPEDESQEIIRLTLTARGAIERNKESQPAEALPQVFEGLDLGRDSIVHAFVTLMSQSANQYWGLHHARG
jgi:uncharacterized protein (TIGR04255 family)